MASNVGGGRWAFKRFPNEGGTQINLQIFGKGHEDVYESSEHPKGENAEWIAEQIGSVLDEVRQEVGGKPAKDDILTRDHELLMTRYNKLNMELVESSDKITHFKELAMNSRKTLVMYKESFSTISVELGGTGSSDPKTIIAKLKSAGGLPSQDSLDQLESEKDELLRQSKKLEAQLKKEQNLRSQAEKKSKGASNQFGKEAELKKQIRDLEFKLKQAKSSSAPASSGSVDPKGLQALKDEYDEKLRRKDMMLNEVKSALQELGFKMGNMDSRTAIPKLKALLSILKKQVDEYKGRQRELSGLVKRKQNRVKYLENHYHVPEKERTHAHE